MKKFILIVLVIVVGIGIIYKLRPDKTGYDTNGQNNSTTTGRYMDIETYVKTDISTLSPIKASLGGTFYVTKIETQNGKGVVEYEDGHNAYVADFTYTVDEDGKPTIGSFKVR